MKSDNGSVVEERACDTPGRRDLDSVRDVRVDSFTNGAAKKVRRLGQILGGIAVAVVLAIPTTVWSASRWAKGIEDSLALVAVRDSTMVARIEGVAIYFESHQRADASRDSSLAAGVQSVNVTMSAVVANQTTLQNEVARIRNRMEE